MSYWAIVGVWIGGALVLGINFFLRNMLHAKARKRESDPELRMDTSTEFLFNGAPLGTTIRAARRQVLEPSSDIGVEHARRSDLRAWLLFGAWVPSGLVLGFMLHDFVLALAAASAGYLVIAGIAGVIGLAWLAALVDATAGPVLQRRRVRAAVLGMAGSLIVLLLLPAIAGV